MKKHASNGRTFYRILVTLLSCVLIMAALTVFLISYQNRRSVKTHTDMLANAMTNGAAQIDGFWQNAAAFLASLSDSTQLARLSTQPQLNLRLAAEAQSSVTKSLSSFLTGVDCASDVFLYLYGKDYLLTPMGVTHWTPISTIAISAMCPSFPACCAACIPLSCACCPSS